MTYNGTILSKGIAIESAYLYTSYHVIPDKKTIADDEKAQAVGRYEKAKATASNELENIRARLDDADKAKIFTAHIDIIEDEAIDDEIRESINAEGYAEDWAIYSAYEKYIKILGGVEDPMIRERAADLNDVEKRLLRCLAGIPEKRLEKLDQPIVLVAHDLNPSDTAMLDREMVRGIVVEKGGATSHSAIIARSYGIPLLCVEKAMQMIAPDNLLIVDALDGVLYIKPDMATLVDYEKKRGRWKEHINDVSRYLSVQPVCTDGTKVDIELNIGSAKPEEMGNAEYTSGVGLFRTEFIYMECNTLPTEDRQLEIYKSVLSRFEGKPVTLRTLDIGGDKVLECLKLPIEQNPFLGKRALRLCFDHSDIFKTQLRAALRASAYGDLRLMFPMVSSMDDFYRARTIVDEVKENLREAHISFNEKIKLGIMIEIPAIALLADHIVKEVDFASIGTNDLTQYFLAVDRMNTSVSNYYQNYHPALFRLIAYVAREFKKANKQLSVCGELSSDPLAAAVFIGLGIRKLSMSGAFVAGIKKMICSMNTADAEEIAKHIQDFPTAKHVENYLKEMLSEFI